MDYPLISVIVPVYKVEQYLKQCVDSILAQTYQNLEIILVDDGSPDNCPVICDDYAEKDGRILVIHKENGGVSEARNVGIDKSTGEYITFIDSDDYIAENYIESLFWTLQSSKADISVCGFLPFYDGNKVKEKVKCSKSCSKSYTSKEAVYMALKGKCSVSVWTKLYKRCIFDIIRFPKGKTIAEDLAIQYDALFTARSVVFTDSCTYFYRIRKGSAIHSYFSEKLLDKIEIIDDQMDKVDKVYPEWKTLTQAKRINNYLSVLDGILLSNNPDNYMVVRENIHNKIMENRKGVLLSPDVWLKTKIKLMFFMLGERPYKFFIHNVNKHEEKVGY